ncbi:MAG: penicillin-binding protein activator [Bacteroidales bacterium]|nr:penicillin-binding protein activator [Bacteroidales bacterium]
MKKEIYIIIGVIAIIAIVFVLYFNKNNEINKDTTINIGVILPLTGDAAVYGQAMKNGIMLAYDESEIKEKINLIFEDDIGDNNKALSAAYSLINKKAVAIIGGAQSKTADVLIPLLTKEKIPLVAPGASSVEFDNISHYFFRLWASDSYDGEIMADFITKQNMGNKIAIFYTNSKYGVGIDQVFEKAIKKRNGNIVFSESFSEGAKDFKTQLVKIKNNGATALFLPGYYEEVSIIIKQIRELGIKIDIYGTSSFHDEKLLSSLGNSLNGVYFSYPDFDINGSKEATKQFADNYYRKYSVKADVFAANAYDCFKVIEYALKNGAKTSNDIRAKIAEIENFVGAGGNFSFDDFGSVLKEFSVYQIIDGKYLKF